jgi:hypothetical protein
MSSTEPCGSLPVSGINVSAFYCHHHLAWSANVVTHHQGGGDDVQVLHQQSMQFGPFDSEDDVRAWMLRAVLGMDDLSAVPWDA